MGLKTLADVAAVLVGEKGHAVQTAAFADLTIVAFFRTVYAGYY